jgi:predicted nucleotidyltransferase
MTFLFNEHRRDELNAICRKHNLGLVVLFGSQISGRVSKESDIDVGVYRASGLTLDDKVILSKEFSDLLGSDKIDIAIISSNSPILMYNILETGKVLYAKEKTSADALRIYAWKLLAESKKFRDRSYDVLKNKIASFV